MLNSVVECLRGSTADINNSSLKEEQQMTARTLEEVKECRYYEKPSAIKREYWKRLKRQAAKNRRKQMERAGLI